MAIQLPLSVLYFLLLIPLQDEKNSLQDLGAECQRSLSKVSGTISY